MVELEYGRAKADEQINLGIGWLTGTSLRLVPAGVLKQAPTRCGAGPAHAPQRVGACFSTPTATSEAMSSPYVHFHY